jgi:MFS transporter, MHS family, citrate/tricarballylate:H+ symporter
MLTAAERRRKMGDVIRAASGNFLELYDFLVYVYFANYIAKAFFPATNEYMSLMIALGTYGVASIARPVGAVILGSYMDRRGRRKGLILTLMLMAVGTVTLALTPGYATIGLLAPVIVTAGRLIQGFSLGVQAGGVNVYLAEIATPNNRGFYCAWQGSSQALGVIAATGLGVLLTLTLTAAQMEEWGWRVPLLAGCLIIPVLFWLRGSLHETEAFEKSTHARSTMEILRILGEHWQIVAVGVMFTILNTTMFYFVNTYTALYGKLLMLPPLSNFTVALTVGTLSFVLLPVAGAISDRVGRWPLLVAAPVLVAATAYPAMSWLVAAPDFARLLIVQAWLAILYAMYAGTLVPFVAEFMPAKVRSSGYAIIISLANGIFGTFTPFISTFLINETNDFASPGLWLSAAALLSLMASLAARRMHTRTSLPVAAT